MQAPLFSCRLSFLGFFLRGIFRECGSLFFSPLLIFLHPFPAPAVTEAFFRAEKFTRTCLAFLLKPCALVFLGRAYPPHSGARRCLGGGGCFCLVAEELFKWRGPRVADKSAPGVERGEVKTVKHLLSRGHVTSIRSSSCRRLSQGVRGGIWYISAINSQRQGSY